MRWNIKQSKDGTQCLIICSKPINFINVEVLYDSYKMDRIKNVKKVKLLVPFNSRRKNSNNIIDNV
jgi:hypothetical protein